MLCALTELVCFHVPITTDKCDYLTIITDIIEFSFLIGIKRAAQLREFQLTVTEYLKDSSQNEDDWIFGVHLVDTIRIHI